MGCFNSTQKKVSTCQSDKLFVDHSKRILSKLCSESRKKPKISSSLHNLSKFHSKTYLFVVVEANSFLEDSPYTDRHKKTEAENRNGYRKWM
ncbi:unnamed protein product [Blepharisma stoltei]|uniref:Uncharacterized protein n=1 Tax=Blepharisma stoltei TaxID=1481888 RepID=A0AAU9JB81_9CILI|nr:unnamed protein product [Blepharisma stoltei]